MTIRECSIQICRENGMSDEEIDEFIALQDANAKPEHLEASKTLTLEALGPMQELFWMAMRRDIAVIIKKYRDGAGQQSTSA